MPTKDELVKELNWLTEKISSQVWTLNFGTLATTWSLLIAGRSGEKLIESGDAIPIILLCIVAMLCELGQYYAGYINALSIKEELKKSGEEEFDYDERAPLYILRECLFYVKAMLSLAAATWLVVILARKFI
jgi:hypothetical protein